MDEKLAKLIEIVCAEGEISPVELAERLDVSVRTVRSYVSRINEMLASACSADATSPAGRIEMRSSSVYRLEAADHDRLFALMGDTAADVAPGAAIPVTEEQRVTYLLSDLLYRTGWITIDDLAQILFVSRATVTEDLREVERRLGRFDLSVERRPRYGIRVVGQELKRRLCLAAVSAGGSIAAGAESPLVSHRCLRRRGNQAQRLPDQRARQTEPAGSHCRRGLPNPRGMLRAHGGRAAGPHRRYARVLGSA